MTDVNDDLDLETIRPYLFSTMPSAYFGPNYRQAQFMFRECERLRTMVITLATENAQMRYRDVLDKLVDL